MLRPGKSPIALRVHLAPEFDGGPLAGFDLTEAGTQKRLAVYLVDTKRLRYFLGSGETITGGHNDMQALSAQLRDGFRGGCLDGIGDRQQAYQLRTSGKVHHTGALGS